MPKLTARHPTTWRACLFTAGLCAAAGTWLFIASDVLLSLAYGWQHSIVIALYNGDALVHAGILAWLCFILVSLHAED